MKEINNFLQGFLRFILSGNILECDSGLLLHIHLGIALSDAHHTAAFGHPLHKKCEQQYHQNDWHNCDDQLRDQRTCRIRHFCLKLHSTLFQLLYKCFIIHKTGIIIRILLFRISGVLHLLLELTDQIIGFIFPG